MITFKPRDVSYIGPGIGSHQDWYKSSSIKTKTGVDLNWSPHWVVGDGRQWWQKFASNLSDPAHVTAIISFCNNEIRISEAPPLSGTSWTVHF